jgi:hypothetical protein
VLFTVLCRAAQAPYVVAITSPTQRSFSMTKPIVDGDTRPIWEKLSSNLLALVPDEADTAVRIEVRNSCTLRDDVIGWCEVPLADCKGRKETHQLDTGGGIACTIKHSRRKGGDKEGAGEEDQERESSEQLQGQSLLIVEMRYAEAVKDMQVLGVQSPYAMLTLPSSRQALRTKPDALGGSHPIWTTSHQNTLVFRAKPAVDATLDCTVWNSNLLSDELIGRARVQLEWEPIKTKRRVAVELDTGGKLWFSCFWGQVGRGWEWVWGAWVTEGWGVVVLAAAAVGSDGGWRCWWPCSACSAPVFSPVLPRALTCTRTRATRIHAHMHTGALPNGPLTALLQMPEALSLDNVTIGCRVVRGPHWRKGNQDGGPGGYGTVVAVKSAEGVSKHDGSLTPKMLFQLPPHRAAIKWDVGCGGASQFTHFFYPIGFDGEYALGLVTDPDESRGAPGAKQVEQALELNPITDPELIHPDDAEVVSVAEDDYSMKDMQNRARSSLGNIMEFFVGAAPEAGEAASRGGGGGGGAEEGGAAAADRGLDEAKKGGLPAGSGGGRPREREGASKKPAAKASAAAAKSEPAGANAMAKGPNKKGPSLTRGEIAKKAGVEPAQKIVASREDWGLDDAKKEEEDSNGMNPMAGGSNPMAGANPMAAPKKATDSAKEATDAPKSSDGAKEATDAPKSSDGAKEETDAPTSTTDAEAASDPPPAAESSGSAVKSQLGAYKSASGSVANSARGRGRGGAAAGAGRGRGAKAAAKSDDAAKELTRADTAGSDNAFDSESD